jgi:imidazolonepropionase-like amidohydrolase
VDRKLPALLASKPDFIKTALLFSEEHGKRRADTIYFAWKGLDPRLLPYIVRKAHHAGLRVTTHVETAADFRAAVAAGADEINHLPGFRPEGNELAGYGDLGRYAITDADAALAARKRVVVVTTVSEVLEAVDGLAADSSEANRARAREIRAMVVGNLQTLMRRGVRIALGSDRYRSTSTPEALALHRLAVADNLTLLKMWCETTPATIFPGREIGRLRDGYEASFLVLEGNPLDDFANTGRIRMRVKQGRVLPEP